MTFILGITVFVGAFVYLIAAKRGETSVFIIVGSIYLLGYAVSVGSSLPEFSLEYLDDHDVSACHDSSGKDYQGNHWFIHTFFWPGSPKLACYTHNPTMTLHRDIEFPKCYDAGARTVQCMTKESAKLHATIEVTYTLNQTRELADAHFLSGGKSGLQSKIELEPGYPNYEEISNCLDSFIDRYPLSVKEIQVSKMFDEFSTNEGWKEFSAYLTAGCQLQEINTLKIRGSLSPYHR